VLLDPGQINQLTANRAGGTDHTTGSDGFTVPAAVGKAVWSSTAPVYTGARWSRGRDPPRSPSGCSPSRVGAGRLPDRAGVRRSLEGAGAMT